MSIGAIVTCIYHLKRLQARPNFYKVNSHINYDQSSITTSWQLCVFLITWNMHFLKDGLFEQTQLEIDSAITCCLFVFSLYSDCYVPQEEVTQIHSSYHVVAVLWRVLGGVGAPQNFLPHPLVHTLALFPLILLCDPFYCIMMCNK